MIRHVPGDMARGRSHPKFMMVHLLAGSLGHSVGKLETFQRLGRGSESRCSHTFWGAGSYTILTSGE